MTIADVRRYDDYQDSGSEWIGKVPSHWDIRRIKDLAFLKSGDSITSDQIEDSGPYPVYGGNGIRGYFTSYTNDGEHILIGRQGALCGNINFTHGRFWASEHAVVAYLKGAVHTKWFGEMLRVMNLNQYSVSAAQPGLSMERIKQLLLPIPPNDEQQAIAEYIDAKTAQIDRRIDLLTQKAAKYRQLKQSLINTAVTRGLDKSAPMKDSGVEWIGEVPAQWEIRRFKDLFFERSDKGHAHEPLLIASQDQGVTLKSLYERRTMSVQKDFHLMKLVKQGDYVISLRSFEGGIETAFFQGIISAAYTVICPIDNNGTGFYSYLFKSTKFISVLLSCTTGIREGRNINYQQLRREFIAVPCSAERRRITDYLDAHTAQIDRIAKAITTQIDRLQELRKALINDVVTGKLRVA